ncbi:MAG TPA: alpha-2-macroglobulin family protein [Bacteroidia bacterium]
MSKIIWFLLCFLPLLTNAQNSPIKAMNRYGAVVKEEFVYIQTDRPFYEPNEMVYLNVFVVDNQTKKYSNQSSGISIEVFDPAGVKIKSASLAFYNERVYFDFLTGSSGGFYKIKVKTPYTTFLDSSVFFEKEIQVQDIKYTQVLMDLELDKIAYNRGDAVGVKGLVKNRDGLLMRNTDVDVALWINGVEDVVMPVRTDKEGRFNAQLKIKDTAGIYMMALLAKLDYAGIPVSRFKHVPFNSGLLNVQFLPEGGWMLQGVESRVAFQCKDVFGKPADIKGAIYDTQGNKILDFESAYSGMGVFSFKPLAGMAYHALIKRIAEEDLRVDLPEVLVSGTVIKGIHISKESLNIKLENTIARSLNVVLRRGDSVFAMKKMEMAKVAEVQFNLASVPMGIHEIAVFDEEWNIKCTRRVFLRPDKKLNIQMSFTEKVYPTNQVASCKVKITDEEGKPVRTKFTISVYNEQLKQYAEDNGENMLSALYLTSELEGKIHQPAYYFKDLDSAHLFHLDLLMMTQGWRRIQWQYASDFQNEKYMRAKSYYGDPRVLSLNFVLKDNFGFNNGFDPQKAKLICLNNGQIIPLNQQGFTLWGINHNQELRFKLIYKKRFVYRFSQNSIAVKSLEPFHNHGIRYKEVEEILPIDTGMGLGVNNNQNRLKSKQPKLYIKTAVADQIAQISTVDIDFGVNGTKGKRSAQDISERKIEFEKVTVVEDQSSTMKLSAMSCVVSSRIVVYDNGINRYDKNFQNFIVHEKNVLVGQNLYPGMIQSAVQYLRGNLIYYNCEQSTDVLGNCNFTFYLPNQSTSCVASIEGLTQTGKMGIAESAFSVKQPVTVTFNVPDKMVLEDKIKLPLIIGSNLKSNLNLHVDVSRNYKNELTEKCIDTTMILSPDQVVSFWVTLQTNSTGYHTVSLNINVNGSNEFLRYDVLVEPKGKPQTFVMSSNQINHQKSFEINSEIISQEIPVNIVFQKSMMQLFKDNVNSIIRQPSGCFEQVSASNYPNIMAYHLIKQIDNPLFLKNQKQMEVILRSGYSQLAAYETKDGGFEWYGNTPPHEGLTAFGLLQFHELKQTGLSVDEKLEKRTMQWLLSRFKSDGSIMVNAGKYGFSGASELVTTAYVTYVLSVISDMDLSNQINYINRQNADNSNHYINALLAGIYLNRSNFEKAKTLLEINFSQLIKSKFGVVNASHSIVRSGGKCLILEIMGLTAYFAYQANAFQDERKLTIQELLKNQNQYGFFGNTQSNVWAMKAIAEWIKTDRSYSESGLDNSPLSFVLLINGHEHLISAEMIKYEKCLLTLSKNELVQGENTVELTCKGLNERFYSVTIEYETAKLLKDNGPLKLTSQCVNQQVKSAGVVQFNYQLSNTQNTGLPQTVIVIPLSSGIEVSPDQLRALRDMNQCDYYEIKNSQLILYYAELGPGEVRNIPITFKVLCNGTFTVPEPKAYIYYQSELCAFGSAQTIYVTE